MNEYFINYIGENYNKIKRKFKKLLRYKFNEDIFHNTIYKCHETITKNNIEFITDDEIIKYLYGAFKMNLMREKLYHENIPKDDINALNSEISHSIEDICDMHIIYDNICNKFGIDICNIFIEHISGTSINNLQIKYSHIKNMKLKIKQIKLYIINTL